jgi:predicted DNA-binding helix-hairpin-helix protein
MRRYGFKDTDIVYAGNGRLSLETDPKEAWAKRHPEKFPVNVNRAGKFDLLKVPGLGPITVNRILKQRKQHSLNRIEDIGKAGKLLRKAKEYIRF